jgi:predicted O-methyltransferase YrrM
MSRRTIELSEPLHRYLLDHSLRESPLLARLRAETERLGPPARMQVSPEQGQFMALLARLMGARRVLEIGTFTGYSALSVAACLPADGRLVACDISPEYTAIARRYWQEAGIADRIELRLGPARDTLAALEAEGAHGFDMAFIDADKENYALYLDACLGLLRPGGLVLVDNVLWGGSVIDPADEDPDTLAIRAFNTALKSDPRVDISMVPIGDGLTLALKRAA